MITPLNKYIEPTRVVLVKPDAGGDVALPSIRKINLCIRPARTGWYFEQSFGAKGGTMTVKPAVIVEDEEAANRMLGTRVNKELLSGYSIEPPFVSKMFSKREPDMKSLIQRQEACIARMREPRTSERRTAKNYSAALRQYRKGAEKAGYPAEQIKQQVQDIKDMFWLQNNAED